MKVKRPLVAPAIMPAISLAAITLAGLLAGCNDTRDLAPAAADQPWRTTITNADAASSGKFVTVPTSGELPGHFDLPRDHALPIPDDNPAINPTHPYNLVELIDIAQRTNKQTRIAWEQARQAAIAVGLSQAAYLPEITVDVLGGFQRSVTPLPTLLVPRGYITSNAEGVFPFLTINYLLLDFGGRSASVRSAKQASFAANVMFAAAHQQLILDVSRSYFELGAANAQSESATQSLGSAQLLLDAAEQKLRHGEGTVTDVDSARRGVAQADFATAQATSSRNAAVYGLLEAMGAPPDATLLVAFPPEQPLSHNIAVTVQDLMRQALERRPDLLVDLAKLRASQAQIAAARSELFPKVLLSAKGSGKYGQISTDNQRSTSILGTEAGGYLDFRWNLYQGGSQQNRIRLAESAAAEAVDTLQQAQEQAMRQVALNFDELTTGLARYDAAVALQAASQTAFGSASDAYRHGVGTLTDASNAQTAAAAAKTTVAMVHSQVLTTAAALAFATGQLTSSVDADNLRVRLSPARAVDTP